ncbi:MAG: hypothetical protein ACREQ5_07555 [Candidatus Dormibacteria bacterium]
MLQSGSPDNSTTTNFREQYTSLFHTPSLFPWQLDISQARILFALINERTYQQASFLDQRLNADGKLRAFWVPTEQVLADYHSALRIPSASCFIFHVGHCGSTLISRLLGDHPRLFPLREPLALRSLAEAARQLDWSNAILSQARWLELLTLVLHLLCRTYGNEQRALIKPSSNCNNLIHCLLESYPENRAIFLYLNLKSYLASVLRPQSRGALHAFSKERLFDLRRIAPDVMPTLQDPTPAQLGAMNWSASMIQFMHAQENTILYGRIRLVEFDAFLQNPVGNLADLFTFFDVPVKKREADVILAKGYMTRYAKDPRIGYTPQMRAEDLKRSMQTHRTEIEDAQTWLIGLLGQISRLSSLKALVVKER